MSKKDIRHVVMRRRKRRSSSLIKCKENVNLFFIGATLHVPLSYTTAHYIIMTQVSFLLTSFVFTIDAKFTSYLNLGATKKFAP